MIIDAEVGRDLAQVGHKQYELRYERLLEMRQCAEKGILLGALSDVAERADTLAKRLSTVRKASPSVYKLATEVHERLLHLNKCMPEDRSLADHPNFDYLVDLVEKMLCDCFAVCLGRAPTKDRLYMDAKEVFLRAAQLSDCAGEIRRMTGAADVVPNRSKSSDHYQAMVDAITGQESDGPHEAAVASETATPSTPSPASWPPDGGWHTEPGAVWFRGAQYKIKPIVRRLLEAILRSRRETLLKTELIDAGWEEDDLVGNHAFTKQISNLRATLREIAADQGLDIEDPLKQYDGGYTLMMPRK